jgi:hypothetical protein
MGLFDTAYDKAICPHCHENVEVDVQFKHDYNYLNCYRIGDVFEQYNYKKLVFKGITTCPSCRHGDWDSAKQCIIGQSWYLYVVFENNVFVGVEEMKGQYDDVPRIFD